MQEPLYENREVFCLINGVDFPMHVSESKNTRLCVLRDLGWVYAPPRDSSIRVFVGMCNEWFSE